MPRGSRRSTLERTGSTRTRRPKRRRYRHRQRKGWPTGALQDSLFRAHVDCLLDGLLPERLSSAADGNSDLAQAKRGGQPTDAKSRLRRWKRHRHPLSLRVPSPTLHLPATLSAQTSARKREIVAADEERLSVWKDAGEI